MATDLAPGVRIGRFVVTRPLGQGGMGTVVEARDPELGRSVALKLLHAHKGDDTMRLLREAQALASLSHPNVVAVHEIGTHDGEVFIAMELVEGVTLDRWLVEKRRTWREILAVFVQAGRGLAAVHDRGMVHRDFKPSNVLVDRDGRARLGDFGLVARDARGDGVADVTTADAGPAEEAPAPLSESDDRGGALGALLTRTGAVLGTPRYMAPEQHAGVRATSRADQFAFCVALWEALYGEHPFGPITNAVELHRTLQSDRVPRPPTRSDAPQWLSRSLVRGLSREPDDRWSSLKTLVDDIARHRRRPRSAALLVAVALAVPAAVGASFLLTRSRSSNAVDSCDQLGARIRAHWNPEILAATWKRLGATRFAADDITSFSRFAIEWPKLRVAACRETRPAAPSSTSDWRAACLDAALSKFSQAVTREPWISESWGHIRPTLPVLGRCASEVTTAEPRLLPLGSRVPATWMALSPDGNEVVLRARVGFRIIGLEGARSLTPLDPMPSGRPWFWSRSGIVYGGDGPTYHVVDPVTGQIATRTFPEDVTYVSADFKNGLRIDDDGTWTIVNLTTGAAVTLPGVTAGESGDHFESSPDGSRVAATVFRFQGKTSALSLRVIDIARARYVDTPIRLDYEQASVIRIAWLDDHHIALNGRGDIHEGESLWVATIDRDGIVVSWDKRFSAAPRVAYRPLGAVAGTALVSIETYGTRLALIGDGRDVTVTDAVDFLMFGTMSPTNDGKRLLARTEQLGVVSVARDTGASMVVAPSIQGSTALDGKGRLLAVTDGKLVAIEEGATRRILSDAVGNPSIRCSVGGATCVLLYKTNPQWYVRVLDNEGTQSEPRELVVPVDVAVSADAQLAHIRAEQPRRFVDVLDLRTGESERWPISDPTCKPFMVTWERSERSVIVGMYCPEPDLGKLVRLSRGGAVETLYAGPSVIGGITVASDGAIYAIMRNYEMQPALVEGL